MPTLNVLEPAFITNERSGPPVLLVQGVGAFGKEWTPHVEALAPHYTMVIVDNRVVRKHADERALPVEQMAADALTVMDAGEGRDLSPRSMGASSRSGSRCRPSGAVSL